MVTASARNPKFWDYARQRTLWWKCEQRNEAFRQVFESLAFIKVLEVLTTK